MTDAGADAILICDNANIYYLTGRIYAGCILIPSEDKPIYFIRRPIELIGEGVVYIRKPEQIAEHIKSGVIAKIALELDTMPYSTIQRLQAIFPDTETLNASVIMRSARAVKTDEEIRQLTMSGMKQQKVYARIPLLYRKGMTDHELQVEIEHTSRLEGCLGQFRISGNSMELYMGNILAGDNADNPTPYDFAMGGEGLDPSLPVGANGSVIRQGNSIMIDVNGNYTGYMTDMTRTFSLGSLQPLALKAHQCSIDICHALAIKGTPGTEAKELYKTAENMALDYGLIEYFMGHRQKAGFVGHGVGIEINEHPVIAPRSRDILEKNNIIALEPKFVIPGTGAVGIENTYVVTDKGLISITNSPEQIIPLV